MILLVLRRTSGEYVMHVISIIIRFTFSLTIGLVFFALGLIAFLLLDILMPKSNRGYVYLTNMCKWGSLYWFKGLRMERDDYDLSVVKKREKDEK